MTADDDKRERAYAVIAEALEAYFASPCCPDAWRGSKLYSFDIIFARHDDGPELPIPKRISYATPAYQAFIAAVNEDAELAVLPMGRGH